MHFEASNGDIRRIAPGSAVLLEDTHGVRHFSKVLGDKPAVLAVARLPELASNSQIGARNPPSSAPFPPNRSFDVKSPKLGLTIFSLPRYWLL
jgi:hypothetical protein